jgi:hypothetical protein
VYSRHLSEKVRMSNKVILGSKVFAIRAFI